MLSQMELEIVKKNKIPYFAAYLQWAWFEYPELRNEIGSGSYPERQRLQFANERMKDKWCDFDVIYDFSIPREATNPLKVETEAWTLLSPKVRGYTSAFGDYIERTRRRRQRRTSFFST